MMSRDGPGDPRGSTLDEFNGILRRQMFNDHSQVGKASDHRSQHTLDEHGFAVEDVDIRIGRFSVINSGKSCSSSRRVWQD